MRSDQHRTCSNISGRAKPPHVDQATRRIRETSLVTEAAPSGGVLLSLPKALRGKKPLGAIRHTILGYRGVPRAAGSLLQYGITPIDSAKTDVTMRFYVENQL